MKRFEMMELRAAVAYSVAGGQALHLHTLNMGHPLFRRYPVIAHLLDQDMARLQGTALKLGVKVIKVEKIGTPEQHVDLCGAPFDRAKTMCNAPELELGV
ncbi:hypothetical protein [Verrucomicrobium spinosum]|uniref:hypothetical protein n=1 Tax=Verrucomicrobium spinosum TaxID=2736 RepID=UPI000174666D|nr:hypothetical protein [Verrucomicrobium spinosum]